MVAAVSPLAFIRRARGGLIGVEQGLRLRRFQAALSSLRYRYAVARETPNIFAMSVAAMPLSRRLRALAAPTSSTLRGRPNLVPLARDDARLSAVRCFGWIAHPTPTFT